MIFTLAKEEMTSQASSQRKPLIALSIVARRTILWLPFKKQKKSVSKPVSPNTLIGGKLNFAICNRVSLAICSYHGKPLNNIRLPATLERPAMGV